MFLCVLTGLILGAVMPVNDSPLIRKLVIALFAYMTFVTALGTSLRQFVQVLRHPGLPFLVLLLVHIVVPALAWLVGAVFYPDDPLIRLGYLIGAAIPIGVTSVVWTAIVNGNLAASIVAVTLDTFLVPIILPAFFMIVIGQAVQVDYVEMIIDLTLMVTIPSTVGMYLHDRTCGKVSRFSQGAGGVSAKLAMATVIYINASLVVPQIDWNLSMLKMLLVSLLVVSLGYVIGYLGSFLLKDRTRETSLTMIYNVGIRNNACGLVVALSYFPPSVAIPITLSILYQQPIAAMVSHIYDYFHHRQNEVTV